MKSNPLILKWHKMRLHLTKGRSALLLTLTKNLFSVFRLLFEAPGHTPGHTAYLIESSGEKLLIWGDILHNAAIQLLRPEEKIIMDVLPELGVETRKRILEFAATEKLLVSGMHLDFPGFGHIRKQEDHFVHIPEKWQPTL
ncbi:hypothetical protein [Paenibacillus agri]|uniref:MBL fold metallo-hydrolase n=1 Tax=Paenibacillus agri TaxID=2744309 RepID=A0A850EX41_9BACL|nr:hypothetical protein [Paenibacillus agri]NUU64037.1 hypothetical protein [Paenibacillus agri]